MSQPNYDFGPRQLTPEMLEAVLVVRLDREIVRAHHILSIIQAADVLKIEVPNHFLSHAEVNAIADRVLLAWPEG